MRALGPDCTATPLSPGEARSVLASALTAVLARPVLGVRVVAERLADLQDRLPDGREVRLLTYTDAVLASRNLDARRPWPHSGRPVRVGHAIDAAVRLGWPVGAVADRMAALGVGFGVGLRPLTDLDVVLVSRNLDGRPPWLDVTRLVPLHHLMRAVEHSGRAVTVRAVAERLEELGYVLPADACTFPAQQLSATDAVLLKRSRHDPNDRSSWLRPDRPVPTGHLYGVARRLRWGVRAVAERLAELGYRPNVDLTCLPTAPLIGMDAALVSRYGNGQAPWLDRTTPVSAGHVLGVAARLGCDVQTVAARMPEWGLELVAGPATMSPAPPTDDEVTHVRRVIDGLAPAGIWAPAGVDGILVSGNHDGQRPWLDMSRPVPVGHLVTAAAWSGWGARAVAERLVGLGFHLAVDPATLPAEPPTGDDVILIRQLLRGCGWLDPNRPIRTGTVVATAGQSRREVRAVAEQLVGLGFHLAVDPATLPAESPTGDDAVLVGGSRGRWPRWALAEPVQPVTFVNAALDLGWSVRAVAERLATLGFHLSVDPATLPAEPLTGHDAIQVRRATRGAHYRGYTPLTADDAILASRDLDGQAPWLKAATPVPAGHLVAAAARLGWGVQTVAERLAALGLRLTADPSTLPTRRLSVENVVLLSRDVDGRAPWLDPVTPVPTAHMAATAARLGWTVQAVARQLADLGFRTAVYPTPTAAAEDRPWPAA